MDFYERNALAFGLVRQIVGENPKVSMKNLGNAIYLKYGFSDAWLSKALARLEK